MNTRKFLECVWPARGPYCVATPWVKPDGERTYAHKGCETLDDAIGYILVNKPSNDLYFAPHALKVIREFNPSTGRFQTFRTHANMREARDFFFDIDAGEGEKKHYATQDDILSALERFLFATLLPAPFVVSSGYGVHVHWIVDRPIESMAWREPAARLRWLAKEHGLHVDPMRTTDQSSVLRIPGTFNYKDPAAPRKVMILAEGVVTLTEDFRAQLDELTENYALEAPRPNKLGSKPNKLGPEPYPVAWDGRHPPADEVAHVCEHMRTFRDTRGNVREPLWHVGIGTIKYCDDGQAKVHEWSSGYERYTEAETQTKIDNWTVPPPSCEKIGNNSSDPAVCARCPHRDLAKNPIMIANVVWEKTHQPAPAPAIGLQNVIQPPCPPPPPYTLDPVYGIKMKKAGIICEQLMFPVHWVSATSNERCLSHWYVKPQRGDWKKTDLPDEVLDIKHTANVLRNNDIIIVDPKHVKHMHTFMRAYLNELHKYQDHLRQYDYVGWETAAQEPDTPVELGDPKYFIHYRRKISVADGSITPCVMTKNTRLDGMGRAGSLSKQIQIMNFYNAPAYMAQQFAIAVSLACPFFRYSNLHGMLVCLTGDTGASKSTGLYFASSLWGHPELYGICGLRSTATDKGRQERGAICANLPFCVDEITRFDADTAHEIALAATQLGPYTSLKSNREFRDGRGGFKSNVTICTSNTSLVQLVNADSSGGQAGIMRVFEIKIDRNATRSKAEADAALRQLVQNYGWIGEDFLRRCLPHTKAIGDKFLEILQQFETDINASPEERYMTACAALALLGIKLGNRMGYFQFSYSAMREWLINVQIPAMRQAAKIEREHQMPETILNEYLEKIGPNIYRVNKNTRGETEVLYTPTHVEIKARYEINRTEAYVRTQPFKDYCIEHNHDYNDILKKLTASGRITRVVKKRMQSENRALSTPLACFVVSVPSTSPIAVPSTPVAEDKKIVDFKPKS